MLELELQLFQNQTAKETNPKTKTRLVSAIGKMQVIKIKKERVDEFTKQIIAGVRAEISNKYDSSKEIIENRIEDLKDHLKIVKKSIEEGSKTQEEIDANKSQILQIQSEIDKEIQILEKMVLEMGTKNSNLIESDKIPKESPTNPINDFIFEIENSMGMENELENEKISNDSTIDIDEEKAIQDFFEKMKEDIVNQAKEESETQYTQFLKNQKKRILNLQKSAEDLQHSV